MKAILSDIHGNLEALFAEADRRCFQGHTHLPGVFTDDRRFLNPAEISSRCRLLDCRKTLIAVGLGRFRAFDDLFDSCRE